MTRAARSFETRAPLASRIHLPSRSALIEHGLPVITYLALSIGISWPLVPDFTTRIIGGDNADTRYGVWMLWHYHQWILGQTRLFSDPSLFYPSGISLLVTSLGPVAGILSLPFWHWGVVAAYNGGVLVGLFLSSYIMYLLARDLSFNRGIALFAGTLLEVEPIHLKGLLAHFEHTFIGLLPLVILTLLRTLRSERPLLWSLATSVGLLLTAMYNGYQFVFAAFAVSFFLIVRLITATTDERVTVFRRCILISICSILVVGPYLLAVVNAEVNPAFASDVNASLSSLAFQPDLIQFFVPPYFQAMLGHVFYSFSPPAYVPVRTVVASLTPTSNWISFINETEIGITWTGTILCGIALLLVCRKAGPWLLFTLICSVFALGPELRLLGHTNFTVYQEPVILPYAILTSLPGLSFMRVSGRWMMLGVVGAGIAASYGLTELGNRFPAQRKLITGFAIVLVLLEGWPTPWPTITLPAVPKFYQQIANDKEQYGVLDLPAGDGAMAPPDLPYRYAADYQMYQMTHQKGIAWAHLSHVYSTYPLPVLEPLIDGQFSANSDVKLNGKPVTPFVNGESELAKAGYRYVVYHKSLYPTGTMSGDEHAAALRFIRAVFGMEAKPIVDDDMVQVYRVDPNTPDVRPHDAMRILSHTFSGLDGNRWVVSPLQLEIDCVRSQTGTLQITPVSIFDPQEATGNGMGPHGILTVKIGDRFSMSVPITVNQTAKLTIPLIAGRQTIKLSLAAGNFRPIDYGGSDPRVLSFGVSTINLQLPDDVGSN